MDATRPLGGPATPPSTRIWRALRDRAGLCTREAALAKNATADLADLRAALRAETQACNDLAAAVLDNADVLDALLTP
jgi:hypothetical protein